MNKYRAKKKEVDGLEFDSIREAGRYEFLMERLKQGEIKDLVLQPTFLLQDKFEYKGKKIRKIEYIADFKYYDKMTKQVVVEDVKSEFTSKLPVYRIKKKMLLFNYPDINFYEIY
jgi:hypothetical protein